MQTHVIGDEKKEIIRLERIAHCKMPSEIILEVRMQNRPFLFTTLLRIIGLHTGIETKQEEVKVKT